MQQGVAGFYQKDGGTYRNPHEAIVRACFRQCVQDWNLDLTNVLDLACGSGEITLEVKSLGGHATGIDPYTGQAYKERTGQDAIPLSFQSIASNGITGSYSLACCSYAMHLLDPSWMPMLLHQLGCVSPAILIMSPHKRPDLTRYGWDLVQTSIQSRVHACLYQRGLLPKQAA